MTSPELPHRHSDLLATPHIQHRFFGRGGGVSSGGFDSLNCSPFSGDHAESIAHNRQRVMHALGAKQLFTNKQVHGNRVRVIDADTDPEAIFEGDGLVTCATEICLGILSADCAPVLFADPHAAIIAAAHAGWKGALLGITDEVIATMVQLGADPQRISCAIGPAIQSQSYRVGAEFVERFHADSPIPCEQCFHKHKTDNYFNLPHYVQLRLEAAGITAIETLPDDTFVDATDFFSYRRSCQHQQPDYGRQIAVIALS